MSRRRILTIGSACAALAVMTAGCSTSDSPHTGKHKYTVNGRATAVDIDSHGGDIEIVTSDSRDRSVRVAEKYTYDRTRPGTRTSLEDGRLKLTADDCGGNGDTCAVDYRVSVPPGTSLRLKTGGGDINVRDSRSGQVLAHTGGGDASCDFAARPERVDCDSSGGDVAVDLPDGSYAVDATTGGGDRKVTVATERTSPHRVRAHSDGGDVLVRGRS